MASPAGIASTYGYWAMGGTIALLALFWLLRGRVRIEKGWAGFNVTRFSWIERFAHWLLAASFVVLALTGLTIQHGGSLLVPLLGEQRFAEAARIARLVHGQAGFAFAAGVLLAFVLWVRHSLPHWRDAVWLLKGGGMIVRGVHPPARKLNAGQKLLFWLTAICGVMLAISGMVLQAPSTGAWLLDGLSPALPGWVRAEMAADGTTYAVQWHGALALVLICAVFVHIYFRTVGIQGAASAMISGEVDANWARQHHSLWAEPEVERIEASAEADAGDTVAARTP